jgi:serine/threonine-protein kinase RsbW
MSERSSIEHRTATLELLSRPADLAPARRTVEQLAESAGFDEKAVAEIGLCVNEAMANVIRHAYHGAEDGRISVEATASDEQVVVKIRDWGSGVDPSTMPERPHDPATPGGLGMICLRQMMDEVIFAPQPDKGMLLTMVRKKSLDSDRHSGDNGCAEAAKVGRPSRCQRPECE